MRIKRTPSRVLAAFVVAILSTLSLLTFTASPASAGGYWQGCSKWYAPEQACYGWYSPYWFAIIAENRFTEWGQTCVAGIGETGWKCQTGDNILEWRGALRGGPGGTPVTVNTSGHSAWIGVTYYWE